MNLSLSLYIYIYMYIYIYIYIYSKLIFVASKSDVELVIRFFFHESYASICFPNINSLINISYRCTCSCVAFVRFTIP